MDDKKTHTALFIKEIQCVLKNSRLLQNVKVISRVITEDTHCEHMDFVPCLGLSFHLNKKRYMLLL